ncbi:hypothetical protein BU15DRAFT_72698 [Melanogaster broomeanus]|nr:hypothetical protein BU15DRAFT_72698 [Melanogaster broomeanus]
MENVGQYSNTLPVYPSPPSSRTHDSDNHSVNASASWLPSHKPPSTNAASANQASPVYSVMDRSPEHENYASHVASASYGSIQSGDQYPNYPQSPGIRNDENVHAAAEMSMTTQIPGSIGPSRSTRRQARAQSTLHLGIRRDHPSQSGGQSRQQENDEQPAYFISPSSAISRPQTPTNGPESSRYQQNTDRSAIYSMSSTSGSMPLPSPRYLPTPVSGSPYSPFSLYPAHSRSASSYSTSNPRSASPALSVSSALTSISSATSAAPNSQTFAAYPLPSPPAICLYHEENPNARQEDIAARYGVERSTISKILKHKTKWMNVPEDDDDMRVAKHRPSKFPEVEGELVNWLVKMKQQNTLLTDALIRNKAKETARNLQIPDERFKASSGWVENFKHRHNIRKGVWLGAHKTLRATRGVGATHLRKGSNESVLSPLNPAFESRSEALAGRDSTHRVEDGEEDMESEDEQDLDHHHNQPVAGPSHSQTESPASHNPLPPIWTMHHNPLSANDTPISSHPTASQHNVLPLQSFPPQEERHHEAAITNVHQNSLQLPLQQHIPVSQEEVALSSHEDTTATYTDPVVVYQPPPPITSGNTIPDIAEAEDAINKVISFVDSQSPTLLTPGERDALTQIKYALFQAASGVPFVRERR